VAPVRHSAGATFICDVRSIHADHNARSLDYCGDLAARFYAEFFHGFIRNGGGDSIAAADIDHDVGGGGTLLHSLDGTLDLIAGRLCAYSVSFARR
jgi:hypothetical protein